MKKILEVSILIGLVFSFGIASESFGAEATESEVISVSPNLDFFIIGSGGENGIEAGDDLVIYKGNLEIGRAYIIEVRPTLSAAEIINIRTGEEVQEGDRVRIAKKTKVMLPVSAKKPVSAAISKASKRLPATAKGNILSAAIARDADSVFSYTRLALTENGYSIINSNRSTGTLLAVKPIALSLMNELWADATAAIDHNLVISLTIKGRKSSSMLTVSAFNEHSQKGKYIKRPVTRGQRQYNEIADLISKIKDRSED